MLFNSFLFVAFFSVVYSLYLALQGRHRAQNIFLLVASCVFYGTWDYRFLFLLLASAGVDYWAGLKISETECPASRKRFLVLSIVTNLVILGFFKYFNFFAENAERMLNLVGFQADFFTLNVILPVGISFYTFQSMSYGIDVYRGKLTATRDPLAYFLMVAFFPHLVAGPIVRASRLLPQMLYPRVISWDQINAGVWLIFWGYWKKVVLADNLADLANPVFNDYSKYSGIDVTLGILAFTFQIYGDFSGYTDIARGLSKLMGFELDLNFDLPYVALSPSDFWKRWHISLSSWLRDYLYISLGGNRNGEAQTYRNLMLTMVLGGLWHGAAWNFVIWGFYHGALLCVYRFLEGLSVVKAIYRIPLLIPVRWALMFVLTCVGWVLFRAGSLDAIGHLLTHADLGNRSWHSVATVYKLAFFCAPLLLGEFVQLVTKDRIVVSKLSIPFRIAMYTFLLCSMALFAKQDAQEFLYFQF